VCENSFLKVYGMDVASPGVSTIIPNTLNLCVTFLINYIQVTYKQFEIEASYLQ